MTHQSNQSGPVYSNLNGGMSGQGVLPPSGNTDAVILASMAQALRALGNEPATALRTLGIRGNHNACQCPLANYLTYILGSDLGDWEVDNDYVVLRRSPDARDLWVQLPEAVAKFVDDHDLGQHPLLDTCGWAPSTHELFWPTPASEEL